MLDLLRTSTGSVWEEEMETHSTSVITIILVTLALSTVLSMTMTVYVHGNSTYIVKALSFFFKKRSFKPYA